MKTLICTECEEEFQPGPHRRHLDLCDECLKDAQLKQWNNSVVVETVQGDVLHFEVVRRVA